MCARQRVLNDPGNITLQEQAMLPTLSDAVFLANIQLGLGFDEHILPRKEEMAFPAFQDIEVFPDHSAPNSLPILASKLKTPLPRK